ncbi:hypothetical protein K490DRAFT_63377 [Saccharata proteae CBS 121410]|uniref:Uncharacterized protein n=1 Tax=Saccharata proteae CBS 121410 TaxID=1314787 RepID=A0A6A5YE46_9PEZI|nr:hypothetical protein K490DRAFT_63377 [Saccharata proteae CBS 121410]
MSAQSAWRRQSSQQPNSGQRGSHSQAHSRDRSAGGRSGANTPTAGSRHGVSSYAGNAWGGDKGKGEGQRQQGGQRAGAVGPSTAAGPAQPPQEAHTPVRGFNAKETKEFLKSRYQAAQFATTTSTLHKVQGDLGQRNSGPWGSKPNAMANGQDFWVQLRKQVSNLESGKAS